MWRAASEYICRLMYVLHECVNLNNVYCIYFMPAECALAACECGHVCQSVMYPSCVCLCVAVFMWCVAAFASILT